MEVSDMNTTFSIDRTNLFSKNYEANDIKTVEGQPAFTTTPEEIIASILADVMEGKISA